MVIYYEIELAIGPAHIICPQKPIESAWPVLCCGACDCFFGLGIQGWLHSSRLFIMGELWLSINLLWLTGLPSQPLSSGPQVNWSWCHAPEKWGVGELYLRSHFVPFITMGVCPMLSAGEFASSVCYYSRFLQALKLICKCLYPWHMWHDHSRD